MHNNALLSLPSCAKKKQRKFEPKKLIKKTHLVFFCIFSIGMLAGYT